MTSIQLKLKIVVGVCNINVWNHHTFQNLCAESLKVCVRNHHDNYFFYKRIMQKWQQHDTWTLVITGRYFEGEDSTSSKFIQPVF